MSVALRLVALAVLVSGFAALMAPGDEKPAAADVQLKPIKYDALKDLVRSQQGKVLVVDVWDSKCIPCMHLFPEMLKMQRKYEKDGLVCISLSLDATPERQEAALKFLKKQNSTIANYWIDEKDTVWVEKFDAGGPPVVFVFDKQGRRAAKFDNSDTDKPAFTHTDIEKLVEQLLKTP